MISPNFRHKAIVTLEGLSFIASIFLAVAWIRNPAGPHEPRMAFASLVFLGTELFRRYEGKIFKTEGIRRSPTETVHHREALRKALDKELLAAREANQGIEVIIRHLNRMDSYPDVDPESKGISPWFNVGLIETYHRGIRVLLQWGTLQSFESGYRFSDHLHGEDGNTRVALIGEIPFDWIEAINFDGDEHYGVPHIYCNFPNRGEPYERRVFCRQFQATNGFNQYLDIVPFEEVERNSRGLGTPYFA